ncbi:MAG: hypothetical protein AABX96_02140 [Nanoarchaeota archaeon]
MSDTINQQYNEIPTRDLNRQSCVRLIRRAELPVILRAETEQFISRNVLSDCGRVPPNCLKAFMIGTAQRMGLNNIIPSLKSLFKSEVGYQGYYLDGGKLFHVELSDDYR